MATAKTKASASAMPRAAAKQSAAKKVSAKKASVGGSRDMPAITWATRLGDLTIKGLVDIGVIDSETSKVDMPANLRVVLSDADIAKIVSALRAYMPSA